MLPLPLTARHLARFIHTADHIVIVGKLAARSCLLLHVHLVVVVALSLLGSLAQKVLHVIAAGSDPAKFAASRRGVLVLRHRIAASHSLVLHVDVQGKWLALIV